MDEYREIELNASGKPTKEWLEYMYIEKQLTYKAIAKIAGTYAQGICVLMKQYGIPARKPVRPVSREELERLYVSENLPRKEIAAQLGLNEKQVEYLVNAYELPLRQPKPRKEVRPTREWLMQKHFEEGVTWKDIRKMIGYGAATFHKLLKDYDIPCKEYIPVEEIVSKEDLYQWHVVEGLTAVRIAAKLGCNNSAISRLIKKYQLDPERPLVNIPRVLPVSKEELKHLYNDKLLSCREIGKQYNVSIPTVRRWLKHYDIPRRAYEQRVGRETKRVFTRSAIPATRFGREFNAQEREQILSRDGYQCQMPECGCKEAWKLEVHHIIPTEHEGTNDLNNGITLCRPCHVSIKNKELHYIALFQYLITTTLSGVQTRCIGETPATDNTEGTQESNANLGLRND
jgi:transposase